jgi:NADH-quinone oxidoreductase subunit A
MTTQTSELPALWPLGVYFLAVVALVSIMIALSSILGERHREKQTNEPYESGIVSTGSARVRFDVKFYLIAMFIFAWAVSIRENGWQGFGEMLVFIGILTATLVYLWRIGALEWSSFTKASSTLRDQIPK